jgi:hypothetical protein
MEHRQHDDPLRLYPIVDDVRKSSHRSATNVAEYDLVKAWPGCHSVKRLSDAGVERDTTSGPLDLVPVEMLRRTPHGLPAAG